MKFILLILACVIGTMNLQNPFLHFSLSFKLISKVMREVCPSLLEESLRNFVVSGPIEYNTSFLMIPFNFSIKNIKIQHLDINWKKSEATPTADANQIKLYFSGVDGKFTFNYFAQYYAIWQGDSEFVMKNSKLTLLLDFEKTEVGSCIKFSIVDMTIEYDDYHVY